MADANAISASVVSIGQVVVAYQFFMPRLGEVRRAEPDDANMRTDVLLGQLSAGALTIAVGVMLASLTGSAMPAYVAVCIALVIAVAYQYALNTRGEVTT